jgi:hypothetical protein
MEGSMPRPSVQIFEIQRLSDGAVDYRFYKLHGDRLRSAFVAEIMRSAWATLSFAAKTLCR